MTNEPEWMERFEDFVAKRHISTAVDSAIIGITVLVVFVAVHFTYWYFTEYKK